jgi:hypothetical protein
LLTGPDDRASKRPKYPLAQVFEGRLDLWPLAMRSGGLLNEHLVTASALEGVKQELGFPTLCGDAGIAWQSPFKKLRTIRFEPTLRAINFQHGE